MPGDDSGRTTQVRERHHQARRDAPVGRRQRGPARRRRRLLQPPAHRDVDRRRRHLGHRLVHLHAVLRPGRHRHLADRHLHGQGRQRQRCRSRSSSTTTRPRPPSPPSPRCPTTPAPGWRGRRRGRRRSWSCAAPPGARGAQSRRRLRRHGRRVHRHRAEERDAVHVPRPGRGRCRQHGQRLGQRHPDARTRRPSTCCRPGRARASAGRRCCAGAGSRGPATTTSSSSATARRSSARGRPSRSTSCAAAGAIAASAIGSWHGTYRWLLWAGYGHRSEHRYGRLLGKRTFVVR